MSDSPDKILVVDDELIFARLCTQLLGQEGYECDTAASAEEGYEVTFDADQFYRRSDHYNFARLGIPAGTLSGNPLAMAAGLATLDLLDKPGFYESLGERTGQLVNGLAACASDLGVPLSVEFEGGMFGFVFADDGPVRRLAQVAGANTERFKAFFHGMLEEGIYLAPSAYEAGFVSAAHGDDEIEKTLAAARKVLGAIA